LAAYQEAILLELKQDIENGVITAEDAELSLKEMNIQTEIKKSSALIEFNPVKLHKISTFGIVFFIPVFVALFYLVLGRPDLINASNQGQVNITPAQIEQMVINLEKRLQDSPDDIEGWQMFYRSNMTLKRYEKAIIAAEKLIELQGETADNLLHFIDASTMANQQQITAQANTMIDRLLEIEPDNQTAMWLAGIAAWQQGKWQQVYNHWQDLLATLETDSEDKQVLKNMLNEVQAKIDGIEKNGDKANHIKLVVDIKPELKEFISENAELYIYARTEDYSMTPVAGASFPITQWPISLELNNSHIIDKSLSLHDFSSVQIIARVSNTGTGKPESGDLLGLASHVTPGVEKEIEVFLTDIIQL